MMTIQDLKNNTLFLKQENLNVELFFLFRADDEISIKRARLATDLQSGIARGIVSPYIEKELDSADDIIAYDPSVTPDRNSLFEVSADQVEQYRLAITDIENIEDFNHTDGYDKIWAYMIKISHGENEIIAVRKRFSNHVLKKGFSLWSNNGQFVRFNDKIFTLDEQIDAFLVNGKFIIFQRTNFEQCFIYNVQLETQARRNANDIISKYNLLELAEGQLDDFLDKHSISRLRKIDISLIEDGTMSYQKLSKFCNDFSIQIQKDDILKKFKPENKKEFKIFVKLLSDDYLKSDLTERKYDAHSKEVLNSTSV